MKGHFHFTKNRLTFVDIWTVSLSDVWVIGGNFRGLKAGNLLLASCLVYVFQLACVTTQISRSISMQLSQVFWSGGDIILMLVAEEFQINVSTPIEKGASVPALILKALNVLILAQKFCMESTRSVIASLHQGGFLPSVDNKDAFLEVPIFPGDHQFFQSPVGTQHFPILWPCLLTYLIHFECSQRFQSPC